MGWNGSSSTTTAGGLRQSMLQPLVEQSPALIAVCGLQGEYLFANAAFACALELPVEALLGRHENDVLRTVESGEMLRVRTPAGEAGPVSFIEEGRLRARCRRFLTTRYPLRDTTGNVIAFGLTAVELVAPEQCDDEVHASLATVEERNNELQRALEQMERLAYTDRLTGAWNRRHLDDAALIEMSRAERHGFPVSMLMIDVDHFKALNDRLGHSAGDRVLVDLVRCLRGGTRRADTVTRWGGEEFVVLAPDTLLHEAEQLARKLCDLVAAKVFAEAGSITVSIGVAEYQCGAGFEPWFARADRALYGAKTGGRNRVVSDPLTAYGEAQGDKLRRPPLRLTWRDAYRSGETNLDSQHESLFGQANLLLDAIITNAPRESLMRIFDKLLDDVREHFVDEERVHANTGFPDRHAHAAEHARLLEKAARLAERALRDDVPAIDLFQFLAYDVIAQHMLGSDRRAFPYLERVDVPDPGCASS